jgi:hypothetical protein
MSTDNDDLQLQIAAIEAHCDTLKETIDEASDALEPFLKEPLETIMAKLQGDSLDKAKLNVLVAYAMCSLLFSKCCC